MSFKSMETFAKDTDGFFARHFDRKISGAISRVLIQTPITPNQITIGVTIIGLGAGWLFAQAGDGAKIAGGFVFLLTSILDGCDGEVARAKKLISKLGGWLDLWGDNVVHVAVFYGMGLGLFRDTGKEVFVTLGLVASLGTMLSAGLASYQTWRRGKSSFTSVSGDIATVPEGWRRRLTAMGDALARRDFVYAVPLLALFHLLPYFLALTALGANVYAIVLLALIVSQRHS
jgi:phosphatidylglycerophosphate synthase